MEHIMRKQSKFSILRNCLRTIILGSLLFQPTTGFSQKVYRLYDGKAPGSEDWNYKEIDYVSSYQSQKLVRNVVDPTIEVFSPEKSLATGTAVIVCPGGGFYYLEYDKEGTIIANWLVKKGITAFVLKYRLNRTPEAPDEFEEYSKNWNTRTNVSIKSYPNIMSLCGEDGTRAIEYVRDHAKEFNIDPAKVGIMGFSAGAFVTMYSIMNSKPGKQPDFGAPIYGGSLNGAKVPDNAPPIFIACAADDRIAANSPDIFKAWRDAGKSAELHIYSKGGHGFGSSSGNMPVNTWIDRFYEWLKISGF